MSPARRALAGRTQADRSAETRAAILEAVVSCVDELGLARTTTQRIALRAGVSVGAVQHHFPSKTEILAAVLEESADHLSRSFEGLELSGRSLDERIALYVDRAWQHYGSRPFRSTHEILIGTRSEDASGMEEWARPPLQEASRRANRLWRRVFDDLGLSAAQHRQLMRFTVATLTGLAMMIRVEPDRRGIQPQIEMLKSALATLFEEALQNRA